MMGCDKKYPYEVDERSGWKKITRFLLDDEEMKEEAPKAPDATFRIIGEEMVGKYKGLSKGQKTKPVEDAKTCKHPVPYMKKGGNKNRTYWTCGRCSSMWERQPIPDRSQTPVDHSDLMLFGRFGNCTYSEVYHLHADYVAWAMKEFEMNEEGSGTQLLRFVAYCMEQREKELFAVQDDRTVGSPSRRKMRRSTFATENETMEVDPQNDPEPTFPQEWDLTVADADL